MMRNVLEAPSRGAVVFHYRDALREKRLGRGFGLIEDEIHALIEYTLHVDTGSAEWFAAHAPEADS
jgi:hypothetical protein